MSDVVDGRVGFEALGRLIAFAALTFVSLFYPGNYENIKIKLDDDEQAKYARFHLVIEQTIYLIKFT